MPSRHRKPISPTIVRATVDWAQRARNAVEELVAAAKRANPHNRRLQALPDNYIDVCATHRSARQLAACCRYVVVAAAAAARLVETRPPGIAGGCFHTTRRRAHEMYAIQLDGDAHAFATHRLRTIIDTGRRDAAAGRCTDGAIRHCC